MTRTRTVFGALALTALALAVPFASAQERGEEIVGSITAVDGRNIVVKADDGREIRITVTPATEVYFADSGDRKLFPNPGIDDLRAGMGVRFVYADGNPSRVSVHFVPAGHVRPGNTAPTTGTSSSQQVKARIQSVDRLGRTLTADVAGRSRTYDVADRREAQSFRAGDMVVLTVENSGGREVVTRIDSADQSGVITRIVNRGRAVTIEVDGRQETYDVENSDLLDDYREGDRVTFETEERSGGRRVVTSINRRGARTRR
jgi:Cu/Ag efflux protein CusF